MEVAEIMESDQDAIKTQIKKFNKSDEAIAKLKLEFMALDIAGVDDKEGYKKVHEARQIVKGHRIDIEKKRKELKRQVIEVGNAIDSEAKRLTAMIEPVEDYLEIKQFAIDKAIIQAREEKERLETERIQTRINALAAYGFAIDLNEIKTITDEIFNVVLNQAKTEFEAKERDRLAREKALKEEAERKEQERLVELEILEASRKQQEVERLNLQADLDRMNAEKAKLEEEAKRLADEKTAFETKKMDESLKAEAIAKAQAERIEREEKAKKEAEAKALAAEVEKTLVNTFSEKEILEIFLNTLRTVKFPELHTPQAQEVLNRFKQSFVEAAKLLKQETENL